MADRDRNRTASVPQSGIRICCVRFDVDILEGFYAKIAERAGSGSTRAYEHRSVSLAAAALAERMSGGRLLHADSGRPFIEGRPELCVSISHCGGVFAVSLSREPHGIDLEYLRLPRENVARRFFTENEQRVLAGARSDREARLHFYRIWTLKEAVIKAAGLTLGDVSAIGTCGRDGFLPRCRAKDGSEWRLSSATACNHILSLCAAETASFPAPEWLSREERLELAQLVTERLF